jgi:hypothetical protein
MLSMPSNGRATPTNLTADPGQIDDKASGRFGVIPDSVTPIDLG